MDLNSMPLWKDFDPPTAKNRRNDVFDLTQPHDPDHWTKFLTLDD
jgi:hypothetical protein